MFTEFINFHFSFKPPRKIRKCTFLVSDPKSNINRNGPLKMLLLSALSRSIDGADVIELQRFLFLSCNAKTAFPPRLVLLGALFSAYFLRLPRTGVEERLKASVENELNLLLLLLRTMMLVMLWRVRKMGKLKLGQVEVVLWVVWWKFYDFWDFWNEKYFTISFLIKLQQVEWFPNDLMLFQHASVFTSTYTRLYFVSQSHSDTSQI